MKPEPSLFDEVDEVAETAADARADEDMKAERLISHEAVSRWLKSWGSPKPAPRPKRGE